jgi:pilus assembly protein CpaB
VVTARIDIQAQTFISDTAALETLFTEESIPEIDFDSDMVTNRSDLLDKLVINPVQAGRPIRTSDISDPGLSLRIPDAEPEDDAPPKAYPFQVNSLTGVADQVQQNDFVDVIATFVVQKRVALPSGFDQDTGIQNYTVEFEELRTTKTLVQRAQVLSILRPQRPSPEEGEEEADPGAPPPGEDVPPEDEEGDPGAPPPSGAAASGGQQAPSGGITTGEWILVLAISDQEAELLEFAQASGARVSLTLRGTDDEQVEETVGATLDILVSDFGLPMPDPLLPPSIVTLPNATP